MREARKKYLDLLHETMGGAFASTVACKCGGAPRTAITIGIFRTSLLVLFLFLFFQYRVVVF